jgi:hypothetical protein
MSTRHPVAPVAAAHCAAISRGHTISAIGPMSSASGVRPWRYLPEIGRHEVIMVRPIALFRSRSFLLVAAAVAPLLVSTAAHAGSAAAPTEPAPPPAPTATTAEPAAAPAPAPWRISVDTDPTTFPLHGFSLWVMAKPRDTHHVRFGIGGFGLRFPGFLVPVLDRGSGDAGWGLEARAAMGFAGYQLGDRRGWYIGTYAGYLQATHSRDDMPGSAVQQHVTLLPCAGYQWFPFRTGALAGAYVQPWVGASIWLPVAGTSTLGSRKFEDPYVIPLAAVHVGYEL